MRGKGQQIITKHINAFYSILKMRCYRGIRRDIYPTRISLEIRFAIPKKFHPILFLTPLVAAVLCLLAPLLSPEVFSQMSSWLIAVILLLFPLLLVPRGVISDILTFFLLVNLFSTLSDAYFMCWLLTKPKRAILYVEPSRVLVFEPLSKTSPLRVQTTVLAPKRARKQRRRNANRD
jgi:hypothetical protein